jgi:hypothetical protein
MPRAPSIAVCNIALAEVRADSIVTLDDDTPEARACLVHYDDVLQTLLEAHDWGFAKVRATLALLATNDRADEWLYAYEAPANMAGPSRIIWPLQTPLSGVYYPWPYLWPRPPFMLDRYILDGGVIYANVQGAVFEYVNRDVEEGMMPAQFKRALSLELASRLAITLLNDRAMKGDLIQQAEAAKRRAMAEDMNRFPHRDRPAPDEVALVRS